MRRFILNLIGRWLGYAPCIHCGDRSNWKKPYPIFFTYAQAINALCADCFNKLDKVTILRYCWTVLQGDKPDNEMTPAKVEPEFLRKIKTLSINIEEGKKVL